MEHTPSALDLEVFEIERAKPPGCNSSSTSPRCTCPVAFSTEDDFRNDS